jgi:ubiquinone/menaquinone biosynthesis C-methylase UbiE
MTQTDATLSKSDTWSTWLLGRRHGNDAAYQQRMLNVVENYRDRVLDGAQLRSGMTLADIGTGDGLIAFGAIARVGQSLRVILTDISQPLVDHVEQLAINLGVRAQCTFVQGSADKLTGISDTNIDVVTTRAVLTYVQDKAQAFREFYRVLKPGGRISLAEPIFQDDAVDACQLTKLVETQPNHAEIAFLRLAHRYRASQFPSTPAALMQSPITNYNERDLFRLARDAGFINIHLELHMDLRPALPITWEAYLDVANHPWAPTLREVLAKSFSPDEAQAFENTLRPIVEAGQSEQKQLVTYITAEKAT